MSDHNYKQEAFEDSLYDAIYECKKCDLVNTCLRHNLLTEEQIEQPDFNLSKNQLSDLLFENHIYAEEVWS